MRERLKVGQEEGKEEGKEVSSHHSGVKEINTNWTRKTQNFSAGRYDLQGEGHVTDELTLLPAS